MSDQATSEPSSADFVQSLARGLAVIRVFDADHAELSLSEVARRAEIPAAAARRFLRTLETLGYLRTDGRRFMLTPKVLELGFGYLSALTLPDIAQPHIETLSREIGESVSVAVLSGTEIVYVARAAAHRIMSVRITIGTRFPAFATSMGRVLLAGLPREAAAAVLSEAVLPQITKQTLTSPKKLLAEIERVSAQGWALSDGQLESGLRSIAVPIRGRDGAVIAALNISTSATRDTVEHLQDDYLPRAIAAAARIEQDLRLL